MYIFIDSKHTLSWETRERKNGRRDASEYGTKSSTTWEARRATINQFTREFKSTDTKENNCQS